MSDELPRHGRKDEENEAAANGLVPTESVRTYAPGKLLGEIVSLLAGHGFSPVVSTQTVSEAVLCCERLLWLLEITPADDDAGVQAIYTQAQEDPTSGWRAAGDLGGETGQYEGEWP